MEEEIEMITEATVKDYPKLKQFAEKVGVACPDMAQDTRFIMFEKQELAASVGVKMVGSLALIRALIIDPEQCGLGETMFLLTAACKKAREMGADAVYLLTAVPSYIFQLSGFSQVDRGELPDALREEPPFNRINELKSVTIMMKFLNE
jgi:N-acetylglutamate synthase-like GNAT family acetyltransferase